MSLNRPMGINSDVLNTKVQHINTITGIHSRRAIRLRVHPFLFSIVNYSKQSILKNTGCRPGKAPPLTDPVCGFVPAAATDGHKRISDRSGAKLRHPVRTESDPPPAKEIQEPSDADSTSGAYFFSGAKITDIVRPIPIFSSGRFRNFRGSPVSNPKNEGRILAECVPPRNSYHSKLRIPTLRARGSVSSPLREPRGRRSCPSSPR